MRPLILFALLFCGIVDAADNPRYECRNGVCRLRTVEKTVSRQVALPADPVPTLADEATKPVEAKPAAKPLQSVLVQPVRNAVHTFRHRKPVRSILRAFFRR